MAAVEPMALPPDFNPETLMRSTSTEVGTFHETRLAARLAAQLLAHGAVQDIELSERILVAVLRCQERDERDPHYGNFYWMREDEVVEDLNAVEFVLEALIPMMLQHGDRLSSVMHDRVLESVRLGLEEIRRLDVLVAYTNIAVLDILNTCLGGELLGETAIAERGYDKLVYWIAFTNRSGHPFEYNSPTYTSITLRALKQLADLVQHRDTRVRARAMAARLALSVALHLHAGTGRWAGPHSRAYHSTVVCETPPEIELVQSWIAEGIVPPWIQAVLEGLPAVFQVSETAERDRGFSFTTYQTPTFALGVASQLYQVQSNVCLLHYQRPGATRPGVLYTRYILDDKWFGDFYHATDRTKRRNLLDEGLFWGVQRENQAIGLYTPANMTEGKSAKACLIWLDRAQVDELWVGEQRVESLPVLVSPGQVIVVGSGDVYMAVRPLTQTPLGRETPLELVERDGDLVLESYNYRGPFKQFWEMHWPGFFYEGRPICCFYLEVAERHAYPDGRAFGRQVLRGTVEETLGPPFTYAAAGERVYRVAYQRDGQALGLEVELMAWKLKRRWTEAGEIGWPMLEAPSARQTNTGRVELGEASLVCGPEAAWLWASPESGRWVAGYLGLTPAPLTLTTPQGQVEVTEMGTGTVVWDQGQVTVEATGEPVVKVSLHRDDRQ
ncbi:hypothetical protein [Polyangium jinanense]|uniref:Uncharacterized protein n=1 Tax=Polyangium jinanense TaxID=2829994 RepID=A0A9X3XD81_9BACT|nr:hypothetical protein [Polyangium jinanense]MDC3956769.1 hypothetical protein [Polyangium jinanense]MDC3987235.1 hypothetical protein [Polyangium jinanense]